MKGITCCKNCDKRFVGCHAQCKEYNEQKKELAVAQELKRVEYVKDNYQAQRSYNAKMRYMKARRGNLNRL